jgi:hypothetical protein
VKPQLNKSNGDSPLNGSENQNPLNNAPRPEPAVIATSKADEVWKAIESFPGYFVSSFGRVASLRGTGGKNRKPPTEPKILKACCNPKGYVIHVFLRDDKTRNTRTLHRLVAEHFLGPCPVHHECSHLDGNKANCRVDNLVWETHLKNMHRCYEHGTAPVGEKNPRAILTPAKVRKARAMRKKGLTYKEIMAYTKLSLGGTAQAITRNWKSVV